MCQTKVRRKTAEPCGTTSDTIEQSGYQISTVLNETFKRRFAELTTAFERLPYQSSDYDSHRWVPNGEWKRWGTSAQSLILAIFGDNSPHYTNFVNEFSTCTGVDYQVNALRSIFESAREDFEGGYVFNVELRVSGEVFGDFVSLARQSLAGGHKDVAAVLACASLEDALKRYALVNGLDVDDKNMRDVINALKSKGLVQGAQKTFLESMPRIRNAALHADWEKITEPDVSSIIGFVEQFLLSKFG